MIKQKLICIKCGRLNHKKNINCVYCDDFYSFLKVKYVATKLLNLKQLYKYYLPFKLFKKSDFNNCLLVKFNENIWLKDEGENKSKSIKEKELIVGLKTAIHLKFKTAMGII